MENPEYIEYCSKQLNAVFESTKPGKPDIALKHQTEGLLRAGEMLAVFTRSQALQMIENQHLAVFGVTTKQRAQRKKNLEELKDLKSDDFFDIPAIERRK